MPLAWGLTPLPPTEAQMALRALWDCADKRCTLCASCLQILRVALGLTADEREWDAVPADDPIRQFKPDPQTQ